MGIEMRWTDARRLLSMRLASGSRLRPPLSRRFRVRLAGGSAVRDVVFSGSAIEVQV
jgi:hypothetical protein